MSTVYKAQELSTGKYVVIKFIHKDFTASVRNPGRLEQRAKALIVLNHEHISNFYDIFISDQKQIVLVCDYLLAETLDELLSKCGHIGVDRATNIFKQAAIGLDYAHQSKILHHDFKPSNIYLVNDRHNNDDVRIVDFGITRLISEESEATKANQYITHTREIFGNVLYMSPEECAGKKVDNRSDIYSLGCVMYEAISGKPPFVGKNIMETAYKQMNDKPSALCHPGNADSSLQRYQAIVMKALKKLPQERYQTMSALKADLDLLADANEVQWQSKAYAMHRPKDKQPRQNNKWHTAWVIAALTGGACLTLVLLTYETLAMLSDSEFEKYPDFDNNRLWIVSDQKAKDNGDDFSATRETMLEQLRAIERIKSKNSAEYEQKLLQLCKLLVKGRRWTESADLLSKLIDLLKTGKGPINLSELYADLATCYFWLGDFNKSEATCLKALEICKRKNVNELLSEDTSLAILGDIYTNQGNHAKAKETYLKLYDFWDHWKQRAPARYAMSSVMLGDSYRRQAHFAEAEQYYRNAIDWWQNYVAHEDLFMAKALFGLGLVLKEEHRYSRAQEEFLYALPIALNTTGVRSALVGAIKKESSDCLFHSDFWRWFKQKIKTEESKEHEALPPLQLAPQ